MGLCKGASRCTRGSIGRCVGRCVGRRVGRRVGGGIRERGGGCGRRCEGRSIVGGGGRGGRGGNTGAVQIYRNVVFVPAPRAHDVVGAFTEAYFDCGASVGHQVHPGVDVDGATARAGAQKCQPVRERVATAVGDGAAVPVEGEGGGEPACTSVGRNLHHPSVEEL